MDLTFPNHLMSHDMIFDISCLVQATLLNPDMCNPDFRLNWTDWKVPVPSYTYNSYMHNSDFA